MSTSTRVETESRGTDEPTSPRRGRPAAAGARRSVSVDVALTIEEKARWKAAAEAADMPVDGWVRDIVANWLEADHG